MGEQGGLYVTARLDADNALVAATTATARGKVELFFGCRCYTRDGDGTVTGWAAHPADPYCPAPDTLTEVLQMLGFLPTVPGKLPTRPRVRNDTGQGRWPGGRS